MQEVIMFLQSLGISERFALPMQQLYGDDVMKVVREDPYRMVSEIPGLGFKNVDRIALSEESFRKTATVSSTAFLYSFTSGKRWSCLRTI